ncbi:MAG: squalene/phytoene synthase family protein, partial [Pseudomonadota bacterium]
MAGQALAAHVRGADPDRYLASLFAPAEKREALWALYAFHAEIARVRDTVSEPMLGEIRLTWWRDVLDELYAGEAPRAHEVVVPLAHLIRSHGIARDPLEALIDARYRDLDPAPFETDGDFLAYLDATAGALMGVAAGLLTPEPPDAWLGAVREAGRVW